MEGQPYEAPDMSGFTAAELESLGYIAYDYASKGTVEQREVTEEYNRLCFVRWLVVTGQISEQLS